MIAHVIYCFHDNHTFTNMSFCFLKKTFQVFHIKFSNSLIIHQEKTKKITTVTVVWICVPNYHDILPTLALNFSKSNLSFEMPYQTLESVFHQTLLNTSKSFNRIFNLLLSVWISDETHLLVFDILLEILRSLHRIFVCFGYLWFNFDGFLNN